ARSGKQGRRDGPGDVAHFNNPQRFGGVDGAGNLYVLDSGDSRIRKISPEGVVSTAAGSGVLGFADGDVAEARFSNNIVGLCVEDAGNLFIMDAGNRRVRLVTPTGVVSTLFEFTDPAQSPGNIKVDRGGDLYISDREHNVIYKLTVHRGG